MRICRFEDPDGRPAWGSIEDGQVFRIEGDPYGARPSRGSRPRQLSDVALLAPCQPTKVVCAGRNYRSLLLAQGRTVPDEPFLFLKAASAVVGPGAPVHIPDGVDDFVFEGELAVVIAKEARGVTEEQADEVILGYTCANDFTVRDWQDPSAQWLRAKSSDSHCPLGPHIETDLDPTRARVRTRVNDEVRQDGATDDLVFGVHQLIAYVSRHMTLLPGDVLLTGTPAGIAPVGIGDVVTVEVDGIGALTNTVTAWPR